MEEISLIAQFVDSSLFDILRILAALMIVPFLIRFQKNKESGKHKRQLFIAMTPFLIFVVLAVSY
ncbi:hypothetical protein [Desulfoluna sp.]|uniref:hypothetical protein n=1 Tax=Desulfoluna sp. TaxID=2045199 RepID=UPI002624EDC7|nr:hypothetical protein [Desulfoluna sp.]